MGVYSQPDALLGMLYTVTTELVRLSTENQHLQQEKQNAKEANERVTEKAANLVRVNACVTLSIAASVPRRSMRGSLRRQLT